MNIVAILLLISCTYTDLKKRIVSRRVLVMFLIMAAGLMTCAYAAGDRYEAVGNSLIYDLNLENIIFSVIPGIILFMVSLFTGEAIGRGDVYVVGLLGLMIGFDRIFAVLFLSMVSCGVFGIICMLAKGKEKKDTLPYIPFLLGSYLILIIINYALKGV